jgi:hypothetical protein
VRDTDSTSLPPRVHPVGQSGRGSGKRRHDRHTEQRVGRGFRFLPSHHVQDPRARPRADRHVGEHRMQRVPQPRPRQEVLHEPGARQLLRECLERLRPSVERLRVPERLDGGASDGLHEDLLRSGMAIPNVCSLRTRNRTVVRGERTLSGPSGDRPALGTFEGRATREADGPATSASRVRDGDGGRDGRTSTRPSAGRRANGPGGRRGGPGRRFSRAGRRSRPLMYSPTTGHSRGPSHKFPLRYAGECPERQGSRAP